MVITISGDNKFQASTELNSIVNDFEKKYGDLSIERLEAENIEYENLLQLLSSLPFFSDSKLTVVYDPAKNRQLIDNIESVEILCQKLMTLFLCSQK
jgi:DNA polymerase III delta subunit